MKSWKRAVTVALCAASLLAGCGGDCGLKDGEDYTVEDLRGINIYPLHCSKDMRS